VIVEKGEELDSAEKEISPQTLVRPLKKNKKGLVIH